MAERRSFYKAPVRLKECAARRDKVQRVSSNGGRLRADNYISLVGIIVDTIML